jgi:hypothetical protein
VILISINHNTKSSNITSVGAVCYNLPDLKRAEDDTLALQIFQLVKAVKAHLPAAKQETVSEPSFFAALFDAAFHQYYLI